MPAAGTPFDDDHVQYNSVMAAGKSYVGQKWRKSCWSLGRHCPSVHLRIYLHSIEEEILMESRYSEKMPVSLSIELSS